MDIKGTSRSIVRLQSSDQPTFRLFNSVCCELSELSELSQFVPPDSEFLFLYRLARGARDVVTSRSSREFTYISYYF